jgi:hypothetical protein
MFLPKSQGGPGGQGFQEKLPWGSPYFGFYCIYINKRFEICLRGVLYLPSPLPHLTPPVCIYEWLRAELRLVQCLFPPLKIELFSARCPRKPNRFSVETIIYFLSVSILHRLVLDNPLS